VEGARGNRDPSVVAAKLGRLREAHVGPITSLVERIRVATRNQGVPNVDPTASSSSVVKLSTESGAVSQEAPTSDRRRLR